MQDTTYSCQHTCSSAHLVLVSRSYSYPGPNLKIRIDPLLQLVLEKDGMLGLFGRGLKTKILANGLQGALSPPAVFLWVSSHHPRALSCSFSLVVTLLMLLMLLLLCLQACSSQCSGA